MGLDAEADTRIFALPTSISTQRARTNNRRHMVVSFPACHCTHPSLLLPRLPLPFHATQVVSLTSTLLYRGGRTSITGCADPAAITSLRHCCHHHTLSSVSFPDLFAVSQGKSMSAAVPSISSLLFLLLMCFAFLAYILLLFHILPSPCCFSTLSSLPHGILVYLCCVSFFMLHHWFCTHPPSRCDV